jgi:hypothetical protein
MVQTKKTDNSHFGIKVKLRVDHLPEGDVRVMDCYTGKGLIWKQVKEATGRNILTLPIDIRKDIGFHLPGDNLGYLATLTLSKFNVIDLDAYGIPYKQLRLIFDRDYHGIIFVTFIQAIYGQLPFGMLEEIGFTKTMIEKCPSLYAGRGWEYFCEFLAKYGVETICHYSHSRKHYLVFQR